MKKNRKEDEGEEDQRHLCRRLYKDKECEEIVACRETSNIAKFKKQVVLKNLP